MTVPRTRARKPQRRIVQDSVTESVTEEQVSSEPVQVKTEKKIVVPTIEPQEFTAILQDSHSLVLAGRTFLKNQPTKVPIEHLELFKCHGRFRIIVK